MPVSVVVARRAVAELSERLGLPTVTEGLPGADLLERVRTGLEWPGPGVLLQARDGWVHPGPPVLYREFGRMAAAMGAVDVDRASPPGAPLPDLRALSVEAVDEMAGLWRLPAVAVRDTRPELVALPDAAPPGQAPLSGARVVTLGVTWATPLAGLVLARLGARVTRVEHPRRTDPFPLRDALARNQEQLALDLDDPASRAHFRALLVDADLLLDGYTPRVLGNLGLGPEVRARELPHLHVVSLTALRDQDRPGYGLAAECRGGWASRTSPPRLGRTSFVDPVAGLMAALAAAGLLGGGTRSGVHARLGLDSGVALLHARSGK